MEMGIVVLLYSRVKIGASKQKNLTIYCNSVIIGVRKQRNDRMTIAELPDIVYHGTLQKYKNSLEYGIDLNCSKNNLDFGKGFYTTFNYNQAVKFAYKRAELSNDKPMVVTYDITKELIEQIGLNSLVFEETNEKWYEFIFNNRVKKEYMISDFHNKNSLYDIVYGNVADGNIGLITRKAQNNQADFQEFMSQVKPFSDEFNQLSFHTVQSLRIIRLSNIELLNYSKEELLC